MSDNKEKKELSHDKAVAHNEKIYKQMMELKEKIEKLTSEIVPIPKVKEADLLASNAAALKARKAKFKKRTEQAEALNAVLNPNAKQDKGK